MKKVIIYMLLTSALLSCMVTGVSAAQVSATVGERSSGWDLSKGLEECDGGIEGYFSDKYKQSTGWTMISSKSTKDVSGFIPIEVQGRENELFPDTDIEKAIETSGIPSSYGGCGPIAMIGILDYFARYQGYSSIMDNPENSTDRISLAYDVFTTTLTFEVPSVSTMEEPAHQHEILEHQNDALAYQEELLAYQQAAALSSGGSKNTLTLPVHYVNAFNELMSNNYHLNEQIKATDHGMLASMESKIKKVKDSIDKGLPATIYTGLAGDGPLANHYVNAYEYQEWQGTAKNGNVLKNIVFKVRLNWGRGQEYECYMDAELLGEPITGVIYYTVTDKNHLIRPTDFAKDFVNSNGQGQYFFYEKTADITTSDGFHFGTNRLRCGYIENQYLVLSANRANAGLAFLEMNFETAIKAMNFDISLWSGLEGLGSDDYVKIYYKDSNGKWREKMTLEINQLSTLKSYPDNYYITFTAPTKGIKFEVYDANPTGDRNKGRIVIGDMILFYQG